MNSWKTPAIILAAILLLSGCVTPSTTPTPAPTTLPPTVTPIPTIAPSPAPSGDVESLLQSLASDKDFAYGYKAYYPLYPSPTMERLIALGPTALPELQAAMARSQDPQYKKALLFVIAQIDDPRSEETLIKALGDNDLKGLSAYLLGNYLYRPTTSGYNTPDRFVRDRGRALKALFPLLRDTTAYPIVADHFVATPQVGDLALGAFVRIGGPSNFGIDVGKYRWVGWEIPDYTDAEREELLRAAEAFYEKTSGGESLPPLGGPGGEILPGNRNETNITVANGTFTFVKEINNTHNASLEVETNFTAVSTLTCTKIFYIQILKITNSTGGYVFPGGPGGRQADRATGDGWSVDRIDARTSPYYGTDNAGGEQSNTRNGRPGNRPAWLWDRPGGWSGLTFEFETCAFCTAGADAGKCYGCITWGFRINPDGSITPTTPEGKSDKPSDNFRRAAGNWNGQPGNTNVPPSAGW